ncbi:MAG: transposase [Kordia sp.]|uniref:transposase n=1 Tax=Kordia sp. TaxID=1965332 RepID=UPI00385ED7FD
MTNCGVLFGFELMVLCVISLLVQSTVELVFGTLKEYMGLRKINTLGIKQANKVMHLAAIAYNLKKYLKFITKTAKSEAKSLALVICKIKLLFSHYILIVSGANFRIQ